MLDAFSLLGKENHGIGSYFAAFFHRVADLFENISQAVTGAPARFFSRVASAADSLANRIHSTTRSVGYSFASAAFDTVPASLSPAVRTSVSPFTQAAAEAPRPVPARTAESVHTRPVVAESARAKPAVVESVAHERPVVAVAPRPVPTRRAEPAPARSAPVESARTKPVAAAPVAVGSSFEEARDTQWGRPLTRFRLSSGFKMRVHPVHGRRQLHHGIDIAAPRGTPVLAPADGVVAYAGHSSGYGKTVILGHGEGVYSLFAHLDRIDVKTGAPVMLGQAFARTGNTGTGTGAHLHYELMIERGGRAYNVNPSRFSLADLASPEKRAEAIRDATRTAGTESRLLSRAFTRRVSPHIVTSSRSRDFTAVPRSSSRGSRVASASVAAPAEEMALGL